MRKKYLVKSQVFANEEIKDHFELSEPDLKLFIRKIEEHKEIYERVIIYEEATGDAVYFYNGKEK